MAADAGFDLIQGPDLLRRMSKLVVDSFGNVEMIFLQSKMPGVVVNYFCARQDVLDGVGAAWGYYSSIQKRCKVGWHRWVEVTFAFTYDVAMIKLLFSYRCRLV
ncbi:hypothetical protein [Pseudomonas sp. RC10]|uniref:hypothetical protein n=1 Tax=Pseudomonas bambusae TaxID=3139142 RepID=UPI0031394041